MPRSRTNSRTVTGPITLADLRWLVEECEDMDDESPVTVRGLLEVDRLDYGPEEITVQGIPL